MPNGRAHTTATVLLATGVAISSVATAVVLGYNPSGTFAAMPLGALAGTMLSPDLDVDGGNISHYLAGKRLGNLGRAWWTLWWKAYAMTFSHRSFWTHAPIVGTLSRLLYLLFPLYTIFVGDQKKPVSYLPLVLLAQFLSLPLILILILLIPSISYEIGGTLFRALLGLMLADTLHWFMDWVL